jgi:hypothetical protein
MNNLFDIATEINQLLNEGMVIHPDSPIHIKLIKVLKQPLIKEKKKAKKDGNVNFKNWIDNIDRI